MWRVDFEMCSKRHCRRFRPWSTVFCMATGSMRVVRPCERRTGRAAAVVVGAAGGVLAG